MKNGFWRVFLRTRIGNAWWLPALLLLATAITVKGETYGDFGYTTNADNEITITNYTGAGGAVVIPDTIYGTNVTSIGNNTFSGCASLTNVTLGTNVASIGDNAFSGCTSLAGVYFLGNAPSLGGADVFTGDTNATVYYLAGTTGWSTPFGGRPAMLRNAAITTQPQSRTNNPGSSANFTVVASGDMPLFYQWQKGVLDIALATNATYTINSVTIGDAGSYHCIVSNVLNAVTSMVVTLSVNTPPAIVTDPQSLTRTVGETANFTVMVSGTAPLHYQWQKDGSNIGPATSATYTIVALVTGDAGNYCCLVTNMAGMATSAVATLTVNAAPPPSTPTGVSASDGMYSNKVQVVWDAASGATSYEVWRSTANDLGSADKLGDVVPGLTAGECEALTLRDTANQPVLAPRVTSPAYDDTSALVGVTYYYWVKARHASDVSDFSQSDSGYRKAGIPPPAGVVASDGAYADNVRIVWPGVTGATSYEVWRAMYDVISFAGLLDEVSGLEYNDATAQSGSVYYYWVKSKNALETSDLSRSDAGHRSGDGHIQPEITINGASGTVALHKGDTLSVAIFLMASSGLNADWWLAVAAPGGAWYYYDAYTGGWNPITGEFTPTYQGALFDFLAPVEILSISTYGLPAGAFVFYFGVDTAMNAKLDSPPVLVYDSATLTLTE